MGKTKNNEQVFYAHYLMLFYAFLISSLHCAVTPISRKNMWTLVEQLSDIPAKILKHHFRMSEFCEYFWHDTEFTGFTLFKIIEHQPVEQNEPRL